MVAFLEKVAHFLPKYALPLSPLHSGPSNHTEKFSNHVFEAWNHVFLSTVDICLLFSLVQYPKSEEYHIMPAAITFGKLKGTEYMEPVRFNKEHLKNNEKGVLQESIRNCFDSAAISSLEREHARKNSLIIGLSLILGSLLFGILVSVQHNSAEKSKKSFYLFETTFEWNQKCMKVTSSAFLESYREESDEMLNWYE